MKICNKCKEEKPFSEFYKQKTGKNGFDSHCKECIKKYRDSPRGKFVRYRSNAKTRGYDFHLTFDEFNALIHAPCYYCGQKGGGVDRVVNDEGYYLENCKPCCEMCNFIKSKHSEHDLFEHLKLMVKQYETRRT